MSVSPIARLARECRALGHVLSARDLLAFIAYGVRNMPEIMRTRKLTSVDAAMSRNLEIRF